LNWPKLLLIALLYVSLTACHQSKYGIKPHDIGQEGTDVRQYIPAFKLPDSLGKHVAVEQVMGKATLIDFWASWCRPCRESANPAYKKLYQKYHSRGFNIIGVSSDRHQYFWKKALKQDSLPWTQLIDSTHEVLKLYKIKSIPAMFLIDSHGKIVGRNLWGKELEKKIDSLLQL